MAHLGSHHQLVQGGDQGYLERTDGLPQLGWKQWATGHPSPSLQERDAPHAILGRAWTYIH